MLNLACSLHRKATLFSAVHFAAKFGRLLVDQIFLVTVCHVLIGWNNITSYFWVFVCSTIWCFCLLLNYMMLLFFLVFAWNGSSFIFLLQVYLIYIYIFLVCVESSFLTWSFFFSWYRRRSLWVGWLWIHINSGTVKMGQKVAESSWRD